MFAGRRSECFFFSSIRPHEEDPAQGDLLLVFAIVPGVFLIQSKAITAFLLDEYIHSLKLCFGVIQLYPGINRGRLNQTEVNTLKEGHEVLLVHIEGAIFGVPFIVELIPELAGPEVAVERPISLPLFFSPRVPELDQGNFLAIVCLYLWKHPKHAVGMIIVYPYPLLLLFSQLFQLN